MDILSDKYIKLLIDGESEPNEISIMESDYDPQRDFAQLKKLIKAINNCSSVRVLNLTDCELSDQQFTQIYNDIKSNKHLISLLIAENNLSDVSVDKLCELLSTNQYIYFSCHSNKDISSEGIEKLEKAAKQATKLKEFCCLNSSYQNSFF